VRLWEKWEPSKAGPESLVRAVLPVRNQVPVTRAPDRP